MITIQPTDFVWHIATNSHGWIKADAKDGNGAQWFLSDLVPIGAAGYRNSLPLRDHSGLFREFAATPCDEASIASFANRNGMLVRGNAVIVPIGERDSGDLLMGTGEPYSMWRKELGAMQRCVRLHEAARKADLTTLERHIHWSAERVEYRSHPDLPPANTLTAGEVVAAAIISRKTKNRDQFDSLRPGDLVTPAFWYIQSEINQRLSEETSPRLLWNLDTTSLVSRIIPKSLLGAIWLQFALAVERGSDFRQCAHCGKWFELSPGKSRSDKQFCSTACRVKAFRQRKLESAEQVRPAEEMAPAKPTTADTAVPAKMWRRKSPGKER